jgi:hypothetical protein
MKDAGCRCALIIHTRVYTRRDFVVGTLVLVKVVRVHRSPFFWSAEVWTFFFLFSASTMLERQPPGHVITLIQDTFAHIIFLHLKCIQISLIKQPVLQMRSAVHSAVVLLTF